VTARTKTAGDSLCRWCVAEVTYKRDDKTGVYVAYNRDGTPHECQNLKGKQS